MATRYERDARGRPLRFTGEQQDADVSGLYYLRARYYDPALGRFWSEDPWGGSAASPQTLNPYPYAGSNPANATDPSGLDSDGPDPIPAPWSPDEREAYCAKERDKCTKYAAERGFHDAFQYVCRPLYDECMESGHFNASAYKAKYGSFRKVKKGSGPYFEFRLPSFRFPDLRFPNTGTGGLLSRNKEGGGFSCGSMQPFPGGWSRASWW